MTSPRKLMSPKKWEISTSWYENFFAQAKLYEVITYSMNDFMWEDVVRIAGNLGFTVSYFPPGTPEYAQHGCSTFRIICVPQPSRPAFF